MVCNLHHFLPKKYVSLNTTSGIFYHIVSFNSWYFKVGSVQKFMAFWMVVCQDRHVDWFHCYHFFASFCHYSALWLVLSYFPASLLIFFFELDYIRDLNFFALFSCPNVMPLTALFPLAGEIAHFGAGYLFFPL